MSYYSIQNILSPNFGSKLKLKSDENWQENGGTKLSTSPPPCPPTSESPLKNSITFLENFFKTNYKIVTVLNDRKNVRSNKAQVPESINKNRKKGTVNASSSPTSKSLILPPNPIPAWIFCTRYSDRPSSGTRIKRKSKKNLKFNHLPSTAIMHPISKALDKPAIKVSQNQDLKTSFYNCDAQYNSTDDNSVESNNCKYMDDYAGDPNKRPRTAFSHPQLHRLRKEFSSNPYLTESRRRDLAEILGLKESQIKIWFQNKRAKLKKKKTGTSQTDVLKLDNSYERGLPKVGDNGHYNFTDGEDIPMEEGRNEKNLTIGGDNSLKCASPLDLLQESFADKLAPHSPSQLSVTPPISPKTQSPSSIQLASPCSLQQDYDDLSHVPKSIEPFPFTKFPSGTCYDPNLFDSFNPYLMSQAALQKYPSLNMPYENFYYFMPFMPHTYHHPSTINTNGLK